MLVCLDGGHGDNGSARRPMQNGALSNPVQGLKTDFHGRAG